MVFAVDSMLTNCLGEQLSKNDITDDEHPSRNGKSPRTVGRVGRQMSEVARDFVAVPLHRHQATLIELRQEFLDQLPVVLADRCVHGAARHAMSKVGQQLTDHRWRIRFDQVNLFITSPQLHGFAGRNHGNARSQV